MDTTLQYVPIMIVGFAASLGLTPISRQIAMRLGMVDRPNERKIHFDNRPLMGGLAIFIAFAGSLILFSPEQHIVELGAILAGAGFLALIGFLDDRHNLKIRTRLIAMVVAVGILIAAGIQVRLFNTPWLDIPITVVWVLAVTNAVNFNDNMDGLAAGLSAIGAGFFLLIAVLQGQILVSMLAAALFGSAVGFLSYNFNPASTFMGDMGALTLGFVLAVIGIKLEFGAHPINVTWMIPLFVLALPVFDINLVVITRLWERRSPGESGKDHTSHRLMSVGLSQRQTIIVLYAICILFGGLGLVISQSDADTGMVLGILGLVILAASFLLMIWVRERYQKSADTA